MPVNDDPLTLQATRLIDGPNRPRHLGLAVSGGSDSMALLWLVAPWAQSQGIAVSVATVDHGLRPAARAEAEFVGRACRAMGVPHIILEWRDWDGSGNLQAMARNARRNLLTDWANAHGIDAIALGHTLDDQAETFLMRLARGSGVDGLSGMTAATGFAGLRWLRPLLALRRNDLRDYLRRAGKDWINDPSNDDDAYERVRARKVIAALEPLGVDGDGLAATAGRLSMASKALAHYAAQAASDMISTPSGTIVIDRTRFLTLPDETQLRLVAAAVCWVGGTAYRPRFSALQDAVAKALTGKPRTLQGAILLTRRNAIVICREPNAVRGIVTATDQIWDTRWQFDGPHAPDLQIRALGDAGIRQCPNWRAADLPRPSILASPAIWRGETLIAAPIAGKQNGWTARIVADFHASLVSH